MNSREVSLKPPFLPLQSGVRMAVVITISSAFLDVLYEGQHFEERTEKANELHGLSDNDRLLLVDNPTNGASVGGFVCTYICDKLVPGISCLAIEAIRSAAIFSLLLLLPLFDG